VNQRALSETAALLDVSALASAVDLMSSARRIAFFGVGASLIAAQKAAGKFLRIEPKILCLNDAHAQAMVAATMTAEDVAVVISYSGSTKDTNAVAKLAKQASAKVIAITRFHKSPLTEFTDVTLLCGANEGPLQGGSSSADISQSFLFDLLYTEDNRRHRDKCSTMNQNTSASVLNKLY
ncbi:MAG: MurR/RpiR family transcriptional regulator, partial [Pygmaiobacter sp.]